MPESNETAAPVAAPAEKKVKAKAEKVAEKPVKIKMVKTRYQAVIDINVNHPEGESPLNVVKKTFIKKVLGNPYGNRRDGEVEPISGRVIEIPEENVKIKVDRYRIEQASVVANGADEAAE